MRRLVRNSSTKSVEYMQQRASTGRKALACPEAWEEVARITTSHIIEARRYSVGRSDVL